MKFAKLTRRFVKNKTVLLRVDYNVPLERKGNKFVVEDDRRIRASLKTIKFLLENNAKIVIMSWMGRPGGKVVARYRLDPAAKRLSELLNKRVVKLDDCIGKEVQAVIREMKFGDIVVLENTRFHPEEEKNSKMFARELIKGCDVIVFDAFAQSHRIHSSTLGILSLLPARAGFLLEEEVKNLSKLERKIDHPYVVVLGGVKVSTRISLIDHLLKKADCLLIGGALANIFLKAEGVSVGSSVIEGSFIDIARKKRRDPLNLAYDILQRYQNKRVEIKDVGIIKKIQLPLDMIATPVKSKIVKKKNIDIGGDLFLDRNWMFVDIGNKTIDWYKKIINHSHTIFVNGPMGYFEKKEFAKGTFSIMKAISNANVFSVVGGGDTVSFLNQYGLINKFSYVSTGGGASLTFLSGEKMPVLEILKK